MKCVSMLKLLLKPELWELTHDMFDDELRLKDGSLRVYTDHMVAFRDGFGWKYVYEVPVLVWPLFLVLGKWLRHRVSSLEFRKGIK